MTDTITIPKEVPKDSALSYEFLRTEGMKLIQKMAGDTWTDHNIHDPGITILEQVCYAITDLAYRMEYDIQDLLGSNSGSTYDNLYSAATILTTNPVTLLDIRKMVIDVEGVKNAWIEKAVPETTNVPGTMIPKGLFRVFIEKDGLFDIPGSKIIAAVREKLYASRSICEDFEEIKLLDTQGVRLQGIIEIADTVDDVNEMIATMLHRVGTHFSPRIPFYTLQHQLEKGKTTDEIFDGPRLEHGFIEDRDLIHAYRKEEIQTSDVIKEIMDQPGILVIDKLALATGTNTVKNWILPLDPSKTPILDIDGTLAQLSFTSKGLTVSIDPERIKKIYNQKRADEGSRLVLLQEKDIILPETEAPKLEQYYPIQNQFPMNYGIGEIGLPDTASTERKAQAKQLSGYLLFFEQVLANYFSQLANFKKLMSFDGEDTHTYFNQNLLDCVPGMSEVLGNTESYISYLQEMTADTAKGLLRKNKFLNHLLARFAEKFTSYGMVLKDATNDQDTSDKKLIKDKTLFLKEYPTVSACKAKAYDINSNSWNTRNISGLEKRIALKVGIEDYSRRNLGKGETSGLHMVEHILLRPRKSYPYPFTTSYTPFQIQRFENAITDEFTRCIVGNHALQSGEEIQITGNEQFSGTYTILATGEDFFEIKAAFQESEAGGVCQRTPDIRYYLQSAGIREFAASSKGANHVFCNVGMHKLQVGDTIEITQTENYYGVHTVVSITPEGFDIPIPFVEEEVGGRWMSTTAPEDPYSLQVAFMLPSWVERYQDTDFKKFVALTIREETPAHIRTNIQWLDQAEMKRFDHAYQRFLTEIHNG
ncbi:hypothetical protein U6A24_01165 [Aquimarina gracilis]|uniref:Uncharacterized protein n=1 Tax=Aquimarina gracilis TaxID=874422 RepID=A0ABU5ZRQ7_9FLAO|nr:hypothetical protein [Aquimarina gracilis]MEB3344047.1 hypothetical protein [Aquimarina gracilis]